MRYQSFSFLLILICFWACQAQKTAVAPAVSFYPADDQRIQYIGRVDFSDPKKPRFWSPGVYIIAKFKGTSCEVMLTDEMLWGKNHNYLEVVLDGKATRLQLTEKTNTVRVGEGLANTEHTLTICKNTESGIGYLEFVGIKCQQLLVPPALPSRRIEFVGNSITCGTGSDQSVVACGKREWYDQHNAYLAYGPTVARTLNAQWQLTAVSGIGLMHSCCGMDVVMPQVYDKVSLRDNKILWDFQKYQADVVTVTLGQNDGIQDSTVFCRTYGQFIQTIRSHYPQADIVCLTSPMGDTKLTAALKNYLTGIVNAATAKGDKKVYRFFFSRSYNSGCDAHPSLAEHQLIAQELSTYLKTLKGW